MAITNFGILVLLVTVLATQPVTGSVSDPRSNSSLSRSDFPVGFIFGASSASYQFEGAAREGGRGPSIWDTFTHKYPDKIADKSNGDVAVDQYHRYKDDIKLMKGIGLDAYRFSISWTRILPNGSPSGGINREGVAYYNNLINELISNGLEPLVTLFHWESPQCLEDKYGGFLSHHIVEDFVNYANICFRIFGDRVHHWITFNEPFVFCTLGYARGAFPPGRCSSWEGNCSAGDSGREPYIACHHQLLAHAATVNLYRTMYQKTQRGRIGITLVSEWYEPFSDAKSDMDAVQRALDFTYGWFMDPITDGDYPFIMRLLVHDRLPRFTKAQSEILKGSFDFIGLNYYTAAYASPLPVTYNRTQLSSSTDSHVNLTNIRNGTPMGPKTAVGQFSVYPQGIKELLLYIKNRYNNPIIFITENGIAEYNNENIPVEKALKDEMRIQFYQDHLLHVRRAIREGADVRGYFAWSLLDDFEWSLGYTVRFGIIHVDYNNGLKRYYKNSALWFSKFLKM